MFAFSGWDSVAVTYDICINVALSHFEHINYSERIENLHQVVFFAVLCSSFVAVTNQSLEGMPCGSLHLHHSFSVVLGSIFYVMCHSLVRRDCSVVNKLWALFWYFVYHASWQYVYNTEFPNLHAQFFIFYSTRFGLTRGDLQEVFNVDCCFPSCCRQTSGHGQHPRHRVIQQGRYRKISGSFINFD